MHDALEAAQKACEMRPKDAEAWWLLGCINRFAGLPAASDDAFRRACQLGRRRGLPFRLPPSDFVGLVNSVRDEISPDARRRLEAAQVKVEPLPSIDDVRAGTAPDALSRRKRGEADVLTIYQVNHENRSQSRPELRGLVVRTLSRA